MIVWQAHKSKVSVLAFAPDGLLATATGSTKAVYLWDTATGKLARKSFTDWPDGRGSGLVHAIGFAQGAPLAALGTDRSTSVWDARTWEALADLHVNCAVGVGFGPGASPFLAVANEIEVGVWADPARPTGDRIRVPDECWERHGTAAMDVSPDGTRLVSIDDQWVNVFDAETLRRVRCVPHPQGGVCRAVRFSPDGSRVAVAGGKWVDVWDVATGDSPLLTIGAVTGRNPEVRAVGWSDGGRVLLTAGADGFVRFWDAASGTELRSFAWDIGKVYCAAFAPDGMTCAAGGANGQVVVWDVDA